jgi:hypothetical protein
MVVIEENIMDLVHRSVFRPGANGKAIMRDVKRRAIPEKPALRHC